MTNIAQIEAIYQKLPRTVKFRLFINKHRSCAVLQSGSWKVTAISRRVLVVFFSGGVGGPGTGE